jgi:hypothetical protein
MGGIGEGKGSGAAVTGNDIPARDIARCGH